MEMSKLYSKKKTSTWKLVVGWCFKQQANSKMLKKRGYNTENTPYCFRPCPFFSFLSLCPICNKKSTHQSLTIQGCRFGPESKPNPGNQYLDPYRYHLWLCFQKSRGDKSATSQFDSILFLGRRFRPCFSQLHFWKFVTGWWHGHRHR